MVSPANSSNFIGGRVMDTNVPILKRLGITKCGQIDSAQLNGFGHELLPVPLDVVNTFF
jgi:hypothetical protein